jgi:hypothetical protein
MEDFLRATSFFSENPGNLPHIIQSTAAGCFYRRNQRLVDDSDRVIAFVAPDRTGGTEDTIRRATRAGKPVEVRVR